MLYSALDNFRKSRHGSNALKFTALAGLLMLSFLLALLLGAARNYSLHELFAVSGLERTLVWEIRLPRVLFALFAGVGLALTGVITQSLFRNPLAEPFLLGTSAGAMLFAILGIFAASRLGFSLNALLPAQMGPALFSLVGALVAFALVQHWGKSSAGSVQYVLLAGIAVNAIASAISGIFVYIANDRELRDITFWSLGSYGTVNYSAVALAAVVTTITFAVVACWHRRLDALLLGDAVAFDLGLKAKDSRRLLFFLVVFCQGTFVSLAGMIPFIALIAPHLARLFCGATHRRLVPAAALLGAILSLLADTLARKLAQPAEIPLGILTGLMGAPFFLFILRQHKARSL